MDVVKVCCYFSIKLCFDMQTTSYVTKGEILSGFLRVPDRNKSTENGNEKKYENSIFFKTNLTEEERSTWRAGCTYVTRDYLVLLCT